MKVYIVSTDEGQVVGVYSDKRYAEMHSKHSPFLDYIEMTVDRLVDILDRGVWEYSVHLPLQGEGHSVSEEEMYTGDTRWNFFSIGERWVSFTLPATSEAEAYEKTGELVETLKEYGLWPSEEDYSNHRVYWSGEFIDGRPVPD